jgi:glycosyltransferase involved in cell wall biosynthesis
VSIDRRLRILYVAYPMLPVSAESCGGAEQMLWALEAEMARRGHQTAVAACEGSRIAGELFATGAAPREPDRFEQREAEHAARILAYLARTQQSPERFDLIHDESGWFWPHAAEAGAPVLATLHLPRGFYPARAFDGLPPNLFFNCVSSTQLRTCYDLPRMLGVVRNGIRLEMFPPPQIGRETYLLWIGRICEEKGAHVAIEVACRAGLPLVIAGDVYPFSYHRAYFEREIRPHVGQGSVRYAGPLKFEEKLELLRRARALLLPSLVDETSSLVAMEAMACGTPVLAFRRGAIPEVVNDGVTGFLVDSAEEMARAVEWVGEINPLACRMRVEEQFSASRMAAEYERLYHTIAELQNCGIAELSCHP